MSAAGIAGARVVVTGSTRGLGRAIANRLSSTGARVVVNGTDAARCRRVADELSAVAVPGSVADPEVAQALVDACVDEFGGIDAVVNNAGMTRDAMLTRMTTADFDGVVDVHLKGAWLVSQAAVKAMKAADSGGSIVNVVSGTGLFGNPGQSNYAAAKAGVLGLTRSLSLELARFNIAVNAVSPTVRTEMTDALVRRLTEDDAGLSTLFGEPEEVATLFEFLCTPANRSITAQVFSFNGRDLAVWSHPRIEAAFEGEWDQKRLMAVLGDDAVRQMPNPDKLGVLLQG
ncbi:hypothetical protein A5742_14675 [Mycolicibacterium fortuitum]|uniref:3-oxoacyl-[acyl-carrier-protein] reductase MabA n=1 Tax=Mycolicibacterium fortuitum TaxID=1766 RepID=A0ABD6QE27_MYCFO|nr:SDR family NAD(P)-dependent oxidoreductase [Mycolicibacterium fortuitum]OMC33134.1 hypothetical protein A5742_14675 [Mycolicibacterium fortuitum]